VQENTVNTAQAVAIHKLGQTAASKQDGGSIASLQILRVQVSEKKSTKPETTHACKHNTETTQLTHTLYM
jgi:hypothetical protein